MHCALRHPKDFQLTGPGGEMTQGADQAWFPTLWQQRAGCGPTAAALILAYLARRRPELAPLCPEDVTNRGDFVEHMCRVWEYVTPSIHGLHRPEMMRDGLTAYARDRGVTLSPAILTIPAARSKRPSFAEVSGFLSRALERECPVAFLNLHNGRVAELDAWHWVTIVSLDGNTAGILDSGQALDIDLSLWLAATRRRGGFVSARGEDL